jgi:subtilisin-like proprotein convertase family protein/subtilisin family serine protease
MSVSEGKGTDLSGSTATLGWLNTSGFTWGTISTSTDSDWYQTYLLAGRTYTISMSGSLDSWLLLHDSSGIQLVSADKFVSGGQETITYTPTASGYFYVDAKSSGSTIGKYTVSLASDATSDDYAADATTTSHLTLGQNHTGSLEQAGDADWHAVVLQAGKTYNVISSGSNAAPFVRVYDANFITVSPAGPHNLTFTANASGTYYVETSGNFFTDTGGYTLKVEEAPVLSATDVTIFEGSSSDSRVLRFTVSLSSISSVDVSVAYSTADSTAVAGVDYLKTSGTLTIPAGASSGNVDVPIYGNSVFQPTRAFDFNLSAPTSAALSSDTTAIGFIFDDDTPPGLTIPTDSQFGYQWYLWDINVFKVWSEYTGKGVKVAVFDQGIDSTNTDLNPNVLTSLGRTALTLGAGGSPVTSSDNHGTAVSGVIAAAANGTQIVGVAYDANLVSIYSPLSQSSLPIEIVNAYTYAKNFDVLNDSWGYGNLFKNSANYAFVDDFGSTTFSDAGIALKALADSGRHGLGTVVVQSAGNSYGYGDDTNLHNFQNSRYIITVASTTYDNKSSSFSSEGASILVSAPGGDGSSHYTDILTTDRVGNAGFDSRPYTFLAGTSFSSPIVSGIVALMLEANPTLGYRDVQQILAYSAKIIDAAGNDWEYNGAHDWNGGGLHYDAVTHDLGFGMVDAWAAVRLAETWGHDSHTSANANEVTISTSPHLVIPDNGLDSGLGGAVSTILVNDAMTVERAEVTLNVTHSHIGDLYAVLTSPSGTSSILISRPGLGSVSGNGSTQENIHFTLDTVLDWGESSQGNWTLGVYDVNAGVVGTLDSWTLNLIGAEATTDNTYIYTDEFGSTASVDAQRQQLSDDQGNDTINAAAVSSNSNISLVAGSTSMIAGTSLQISANTSIENAIGGDGNDQLTGNQANNRLTGMRGNDTLDGGAGIDTAIYQDKKSDFTITKTSNGFTIVDTTGTEGSDTLINIERLQFSDTTLAFDIHGNAGLAYRLYQAAFDRKPDAAGLGYWIEHLDTGLDMNDVAYNFLNSDEFVTLYGKNVSNTAFVTQLYENVLHREPETAGYQYWVNVLDTGLGSRQVVLASFSDSAENQAQVIGSIQNGIEFTPYG